MEPFILVIDARAIPDRITVGNRRIPPPPVPSSYCTAAGQLELKQLARSDADPHRFVMAVVPGIKDALNKPAAVQMTAQYYPANLITGVVILVDWDCARPQFYVDVVMQLLRHITPIADRPWVRYQAANDVTERWW